MDNRPDVRALAGTMRLVATGDLRVGLNSIPRIPAVDQEDSGARKL